MRSIGRGALGVGKFLLANAAMVAFWLTLGLGLTLVFGVTGRSDRWVREHNVSPSLLVAAAVVITIRAQRGARQAGRAGAASGGRAQP